MTNAPDRPAKFHQPAQPTRPVSEKPAAFGGRPTRIGVVFARRITYRHNDATGANFYELTANTDPTNATDPRSIIIEHLDSDIFQAIVAADPRVDDLFRDESRDLYPRLEVTPGERVAMPSKPKLQLYRVKSWKPMEMSGLEEKQRDIIRKFDRLHDVGKEYGLGRQARNDIIRKWQKANPEDFAFQSEVELRCTKFIGTYDLDYEPEYDTNIYPRDTEVIMPELNTAPLVAAAITQGKDDPNPTPSPDEPSAEVKRHWANDDEKFSIFSKRLVALATTHNIDPGHAFIEGLHVLKVKIWADYKGTASEAYKAIEAAWKPAEPPETKEPSNKAADDSASSVEPPIANEPIVAPKKADSVEPSKPTEIVIEKLSPDEPRPIEMVTTIDSSTGEIIVFDPNRAINLTKARSALVNRLVQDKVLVKGVDYGEVPGTDKATLLKPGAEKLLSAFQLYDKFTDVAIERNWKDGFFFYEYECTLYDRETGKAIGSGIGSCNSMEKKYRFRWVTKDRVPKTLKVDELPSKGGKIGEFKFAIDKAETSGKYGKPEAYWKQFKDAIAAGSHVTTQRATSRGNSDYIEIDTTMYGIPNEDIFDLVNTISKMAQKRALVAAALNATGASAVFTQDQEDFTDFGLIEAAIA